MRCRGECGWSSSTATSRIETVRASAPTGARSCVASAATRVQAAAARWAADEEKPRPRRRTKAAAKPAVAGEQPRKPRRYTPVPRFLRAVALAVARQGAGATGTAAAGAEGRAELDAVTAFRLEVKRVGSLLNQALRVIHTWGGREGGKNRSDLVVSVEATGRKIAEILEAVKERSR